MKTEGNLRKLLTKICFSSLVMCQATAVWYQQTTEAEIDLLTFSKHERGSY